MHYIDLFPNFKRMFIWNNLGNRHARLINNKDFFNNGQSYVKDVLSFLITFTQIITSHQFIIFPFHPSRTRTGSPLAHKPAWHNTSAGSPGSQTGSAVFRTSPPVLHKVHTALVPACTGLELASPVLKPASLALEPVSLALEPASTRTSQPGIRTNQPAKH